MGDNDQRAVGKFDALAGTLVGSNGLSDLQEAAWVEVISKMEEVYANLLQDEVTLEEKNAELEEAQRFIKSVLSSMSDLLIVCDRTGAIRQVNDAVLQLTGFEENWLIGRQFEDLLIAQDRLSEASETEARLLTKDGESDLLSLSCTSRKDRRGRAAGKVITARPIGELRRAYAALEQAHTDLKQSQQRMIHAEKMASLGRLVAGVAHELNNPIGFVHANAHVLTKYVTRLVTYLSSVHASEQENELSDLRRDLRIDDLLDDLPPLIDGIMEGAERSRDIVKGLRRMSFSGAEPSDLINVAEMVQTALIWARRGIKTDVEIRMSLAPDLFISGRKSEIQQVALNIIQNGFDAMATLEHPVFEIESYQEDQQAVIRFRDHGPGIRPENLSKIFEPFFTTKDIGEGTGLGLWVSFDIIKAHEGDLMVANHPRGGSVFEIHLPAAG